MTDSCRCSGRTQSAMSGPGLLLLRVPEEEGSGVAEEEEEDEDSDAFTVHLRHRSSPTPRRRDRSRDEADEPPAGGRRKVLFADACGRELEHWFRYGPFDETPSPEEKPEAVCWLLPDFQVPAEPWLLLQRVREQGVEVEAVRPVEGEPLSVRGLARVLNVSFRKTVHARATLDGWATHYDHPAAYVESAPDGETDLFAFVLSYPRLYARPGARLHFAVRYEAGDDPARSAVRWANNGGRDYALVCAATPAGEGERRRGSAGSAPPALERRGCLKPPSLRYWTRDEDVEDQDIGIHDWSHTATPPRNSTLQIPKVQVSPLLTQPRLDRGTEIPPASDGGAEKPPASGGDVESPTASDRTVENPPASDEDAKSPPALNGDVKNPPALDIFISLSDSGIERLPPLDRGTEKLPLSDRGMESPPPSDMLPPPSDREIERPFPSERVTEKPPLPDRGMESPPPSNVLPQPSDREIESPLPSDRGAERPPLSDRGMENPPPSYVLPPPLDRGIERPPPSDRAMEIASPMFRAKETPPPSDELTPPPRDGGSERPLPLNDFPSDWREARTGLDPPGEQPEPLPGDLAGKEGLPLGVGWVNARELSGPSGSSSSPVPARVVRWQPPMEGTLQDRPQASPCPGMDPWPGQEEGQARAGTGTQGEVGIEPDLEALVTLKEVVTLTSRWVQVLVFMRVAADSASSLLWCTLYLLSILLP